MADAKSGKLAKPNQTITKRPLRKETIRTAIAVKAQSGLQKKITRIG